MERGTDREREAVRREWVAMERRRRAATRLLEAIVLTLGGVVLFMLAATRRACLGDAGVPPACRPVTGPSVELAGVLLGALAVAVGMWRGWRAFGD